MTVHWLDPVTMGRRSRGIAYRRIHGRHTYDVIADAIESILDDFAIKDRCSMMITDNGSNILRAFRVFGDSGPDPDLTCEDTENVHESDIVPDVVGVTALAPILEQSDNHGRLPPHHLCAAHTLSLLATADAEAARSDQSYKEIERLSFAKFWAIFNKQNKSPMAANIVKKHLGMYFIVPGSTRCISQFDALELLIQKEEKLGALCKELDLPMFKRLEIHFLVEYCKIIEPIAQGLDILQDEKNIYMGYLLPTLTVVKSALSSLSDLRWCEPLKNALLRGFKKRFSEYFENPDFQVAACLVPRFKIDWVPLIKERQKLHSTLSEEFLKAARKESSKKATTAGSSRPQTPDSTKVDKFFSAITRRDSNDRSLQMEWVKAEVELERYLQDIYTGDVEGMSSFCKKLFVRCNTAIPSSAHYEKMFSSASLVITNRHGRRSDLDFEKQLLMKFNNYFK